jgi:hypothetical protein
VDLHKFGIKFFAAPPTEVRLAEFIPVFHRWIQNHVVEGLLIDVADYSHVVDGPGIVLVAHDGNYAMDETGGRLGLLYVRKQPLAGDLAGRLARAAEIALEACGELEGAPELAGWLKFRTDEILVFTNDRLVAPNTEETRKAFEPALSAFLSRLLPEVEVELEHKRDPRERFAVTVKVRGASDLGTLLGRLAA